MESAGVADLKARLSEYLARVKSGEEVLVTDRGRPVARLVPVGAETIADDLMMPRRRRGCGRWSVKFSCGPALAGYPKGYSRKSGRKTRRD